ncbi:hypothetical protein ACP70R_024159 [Stipagrostis hirtigluma subsp. patula]
MLRGGGGGGADRPAGVEHEPQPGGDPPAALAPRVLRLLPPPPPAPRAAHRLRPRRAPLPGLPHPRLLRALRPTAPRARLRRPRPGRGRSAAGAPQRLHVRHHDARLPPRQPPLQRARPFPPHPPRTPACRRSGLEDSWKYKIYFEDDRTLHPEHRGSPSPTSLRVAAVDLV